MKDWEIEQIIFNELMAEPADRLSYAAIIMLPEYRSRAKPTQATSRPDTTDAQ